MKTVCGGGVQGCLEKRYRGGEGRLQNSGGVEWGGPWSKRVGGLWWIRWIYALQPWRTAWASPLLILLPPCSPLPPYLIIQICLLGHGYRTYRPAPSSSHRSHEWLRPPTNMPPEIVYRVRFLNLS